MIEGIELVIKVAEKLGDNKFAEYVKEFNGVAVGTVDGYLHDKAAAILFSKGMAGKITIYMLSTDGINIGQGAYVDFWSGTDNNGTLTPEKILNVWLEIEE